MTLSSSLLQRRSHAKALVFAVLALGFIEVSSQRIGRATLGPEANKVLDFSSIPPTASPQADGELSASFLSSPPRPRAVFPLTDQSLASSPGASAIYVGGGQGITWPQDDEAGIVLQCSQEGESLVLLDPVNYGQQGPWALNLWFKPSDVSGGSYQYLFANAAADSTTANAFSPNQVRLFFPEEATPGFGLFRAVVVDSDDPSDPAWVDSDGQVSLNFSSTLTPSLEDGQVAMRNIHLKAHDHFDRDDLLKAQQS
ncbi:hypothetical protein WJX73_003382 [Symbiochloris irregularis]|uniref:Uncharacterized protein n=1 Tax=Symbiochloris irregularis TaxID=706552 RepID=A0AAW1PHH1_9CHLO